MGVDALIPARGGSKRIPRKNIADLGGQPLIMWTVRAAQRAGCRRVVVSTEDEAIAALMRSKAVEVLPRPKELAEDHVPTRDVTLHVIRDLGLSGPLALLHPTSPFRHFGWLREAIKRYDGSGAVVSFTNDELNGAIYLADAGELREAGGSFFRVGPVDALHMPMPDGLDIDHPEDLEFARKVVEQGRAS